MTAVSRYNRRFIRTKFQNVTNIMRTWKLSQCMITFSSRSIYFLPLSFSLSLSQSMKFHVTYPIKRSMEYRLDSTCNIVSNERWRIIILRNGNVAEGGGRAFLYWQEQTRSDQWTLIIERSQADHVCGRDWMALSNTRSCIRHVLLSSFRSTGIKRRR